MEGVTLVTMIRAGSWWLIYCTDVADARGKDETSTPGISPSFSTTTTPPPAIPAVRLLTMIHRPLATMVSYVALT